MTSIASIVGSNYADYTQSASRLVDATNSVDTGRIGTIAKAQQGNIQADVKLQTSIVALKAANESQALVLDLFA